MLKYRRTILQAGAGLLIAAPWFTWRQALALTPACSDEPTARQIEGSYYTLQTPRRSTLIDGLPGSYGNSTFRRTPHLHVKVQGPGTPLLTTQLYFPDQVLNLRDSFFNPDLLVKWTHDKSQALFDFVLPVRAKG